ncbi:hypothetical protein SAMN06269185_1318 [Natronoarchaeum philippinense]|uniref:Uncharacterized protein n=1 Tax=Natronoarchaeum philippinense TaxID=558529 RepID=A0A285NBR8_NATPI|nr:hypothetical protein [Natronoarchaeum philippinense]SNZ06880.1 hypothetical protein SAMN06269185_1318 [Natronoarchaeum philippinense]
MNENASPESVSGGRRGWKEILRNVVIVVVAIGVAWTLKSWLYDADETARDR